MDSDDKKLEKGIVGYLNIIFGIVIPLVFFGFVVIPMLNASSTLSFLVGVILSIMTLGSAGYMVGHGINILKKIKGENG